MSEPVRVDWSQIKAHWPSGETCVLLMDRRAIHIVLSIFDRFAWPATFSHANEAAEDWDYIQRIMADAEYELGVAMPLSEIIPLIDDVESLLAAIRDHAQCCGPVDATDGDWYTDMVVDEVGSVPENIINAGFATGPSDWAGFDDYKCIIAHVMVESMERNLRDLVPLYGTSGEILGGIGAVLSIIGTIAAPAGPLAVGIIGTTIAVGGLMVLLAGLGEIATEALADSVSEDAEELACAIYQADGSDAAVVALQNKLDELYSDVNAAVLKAMNLGPSLKALYAGRYDQIDIAANMASQGYDPEDYDCTCTEPPPEGDIYGIAIRVTEHNSEHTNRTIPSWNWSNEGGSQYFPGTGCVRTKEQMGGTETPGYDLPTPRVMVVGNDAARAAIVGFCELNQNPSTPGESANYGIALNSGTVGERWSETRFDTPQIFVSNDGGVSGAWYPANVAFKATNGDDYTIVDNEVWFRSVVTTGHEFLQLTFTKV
jgi:hypothetical protein